MQGKGTRKNVMINGTKAGQQAETSEREAIKSTIRDLVHSSVMTSLPADGGDCVHCGHRGSSALLMPALLTSLLDDPLSDLECRLVAFWVTVIAEGEGGDHRS